MSFYFGLKERHAVRGTRGEFQGGSDKDFDKEFPRLVHNKNIHPDGCSSLVIKTALTVLFN
jgi:hypothetical protein